MQAGRFLDNSPDDASALPETAVLRVLWMTAQGMVWPWLLQSLCRQDAIERAMETQLISPPVGEHLGFHITDAGRQRIVDWYRENRPGTGTHDDAEEWRAVTRR
ncbi:hypothetical protein ACWGE0_23095 [Lentzea sp. NPDC054927]